MTYLVDIDGTICTIYTNHKEYHKAEPYKDRIEKINKLYDKDLYTIPALFYITKPRHFTEGLNYIGDGTNSTLEHYFKCELNEMFSKPMYEIEREYEYLLD